MSKVKMETRLAASADLLWKTIGGFNALPAWHPAIEKSESDGDRKGSVRTLKLVGGGTVTERLEHISDVERVYRYSILNSPLPVAGYTAEIRVIDNGDGTSTVTWSSEFQPANLPESDAVKAIQGIYQAGFDNLKKMFGG
ncbi:MAG: SRPBCC family protein [Betaproteobacteria bacterium]|nr:SRPBCC family protein [Betaproteobacteria bacterium]